MDARNYNNKKLRQGQGQQINYSNQIGSKVRSSRAAIALLHLQRSHGADFPTAAPRPIRLLACPALNHGQPRELRAYIRNNSAPPFPSFALVVELVDYA
jgi:hypothetical protein